MSRYTTITSPFIKRRLTHTPWSNRQYIDDLIHLHRYIRNQPRQWATALHFSLLRKKYPADYLELLKEESIEWYERVVERIAEETKNRKEIEHDRREEEEALRDDWYEAGGLN